MSKGRVISIINQKGGIGKSTVAGTLVTGLTLRGKKALLIELDPQGNVSFTYRADVPADGQPNIMDSILNGVPLQTLVQHTTQGDIIPAVPALVRADIDLYKNYKDDPKQMLLLKQAIDPLREKYDFIIIDNAPSLNRMSFNALVASTEAIVPAKPEVYSLQAIGQLRQTIESVQNRFNPNLKVTGVLLTMYEGRTSLHKGIAETLKAFEKQLNTKLIKYPIRKSIDVGTAQDRRISVFEYKPKSPVVADYNAVIGLLLKK